jgi:lipopolysaccharide/colanic/teichoic acid biosynthesis glycosyltransferase
VGLNGRVFTLLKFRSMVYGAEKMQAQLMSQNVMSGPVFKIEKDPRITTVGRFIRKFSIDELPQLWNIFLGQMSVVGPRPLPTYEVAKFVRWQRRRLSMKPGLTCIWQIEGRSKITDFDDWMKLDLQYIDNWSFGLDMKIFFKTIPMVLFGHGAH